MAITASEARKTLFPLIEQVNNDRAPVEITSKRGNAVLMSAEDYEAWQETRLVNDMLRDPFSGIGKPEPLKYGISGGMSRRINDEHRLVYIVRGDDLILLQSRYHYTK